MRFLAFLVCALILSTTPSRSGRGGEVPVRALSDWTHHNNAAHLAERRGNLDRAAKAIRIAIEAIRPHQAEVPDLMIRSNADYARILVAMNRHAEAEPLARWVLAARRTRPKVRPIDLGRDLNTLALIVRHLGRNEEAERLLRAALPNLEQAAGPARADLLVTLETLADVSARQGRDDASMMFYRRALGVRESTSVDGTRLAEAAEASAGVLRLVNRLTEAEKYESQAKAIRDSMAESAGGADATESLAGVLRRAGREDEAEELEVKAKVIRDRIATEAARARRNGPLIGFGRP